MNPAYRFLLPALFLAAACAGDDAPGDANGSTGAAPASTGESMSASTPSGSATLTPDTEGPTTQTATTAADSSGGSTSDTAGSGVCRYRCEVASDCFVEDVDLQLTCEVGDCFTACEENVDCVPSASGWLFNPCETNLDCPGGVCVDYGSGAGCGREPSEQVDCVAAGLEDVEAVDVEGNSVTVCGDNSWACEVGRCTQPVSDCNQTGCLDGLSCGTDGRCSCDTDDACLVAGIGNACQPDGTCATACEDVTACGGLTFGFDGGAVVCEP